MLELKKKEYTCPCGHVVREHNGSNWGTASERSSCLVEDCNCSKFNYNMSAEEAYKEVDDFLKGF